MNFYLILEKLNTLHVNNVKVEKWSRNHSQRELELLNLIYTDICGPLNVHTRTGAMYFITFIDDFSKYGYIYLIKNKHEAL